MRLGFLAALWRRRMAVDAKALKAMASIAVAAAVISPAAHAADRLGAYNVDLNQTTVSGLSAGAFFAAQMQVAHSAQIKGMGSIAGGPYFCAEGSLKKAYNAKTGDAGSGIYAGQCMGGNFNGVNAANMAVNEARQEASAGRIDALSNLANARIFLYGGTQDPTVVPAVVATEKPFFAAVGVPDSNIRVETTNPDGHAMPMLDSRSWANVCGAKNPTYGYGSVPPWMSNCNYDTAGLMLQHFYGALKPRVSNDKLTGKFIQYDQTEFAQQAGARYLNAVGFAYVPAACAAGQPCRIHIALHGCHQVWDQPAGDSGPNMGDKFYRYAGYNEWAENNNIIVLYPQATKTPGVNPRGCFDWWGYEEAANQTGPCDNVGQYSYGQCSAARYHTREGAQIKAVWAMAERVASGVVINTGNTPVVRSVLATSESSCSTITANVSDADNDLARVEVAIDGSSAVQAASAGNGSWTYRSCPGTGAHTAIVVAYDAQNHASAALTASFTINSNGGGGLTPGSGTWKAETNLFGLANASVYVPKNPNPAVLGGRRALMLSLHGCLQSANDVVNRHFNWEDVAEQYGMVVVAPTTPSAGRVVSYPSNCWNWFGTSHSRTADDVGKLLQLVEAIKSRSELSIDPAQVYVSGLSAGGGETHVLACIAPDVFAGMGLNAAPALGSTASGVSVAPTRSAADVAATCRQLAGSNASLLGSQVASVIYGSSDSVVNTGHDVVNADGMKLVYGANTAAQRATIPGGGSESSWSDANGRKRVSLIAVSGMGHAWPAGSTGTQNTNYVSTQYVNYPQFLTKTLFDTNLRVLDGQPVLRCNPLSVSGSSVTLSCAATTGNGGTMASYRVQRSGPSSLTETVAGATLNRQYSGLANGHYALDVVATDNRGVASNAVRLEFDIGGVTVNQPPVVNSLAASVSGNCVTVNGNASDADGQVVSVEIRLGGSSQGSVAPAGGVFQKQVCGLAAGSYTASALATDDKGARSAELSATPVNVQPVVQSVSATLNQHYSAGRISFNQYVSLGLSYGYFTPVTLYQCAAGWVTSPTCTGP